MSREGFSDSEVFALMRSWGRFSELQGSAFSRRDTGEESKAVSRMNWCRKSSETEEVDLESSTNVLNSSPLSPLQLHLSFLGIRYLLLVHPPME